MDSIDDGPQGPELVAAERHKLATIALLFIGTVALGASLYALRSVLLPFVMALFFSYLLNPMTSHIQQRLRLPRGLAIIVTILIGVMIVGALGSVIADSVDDLAQNADRYQERVAEFGANFEEWLESVGVDFDVERDNLMASIRKVPVRRYIADVLGGAAGVASRAFLMLIFLIFLVAGHDPRDRARGIWADIDQNVRRYFGVKALTSLATGLLTWVILGLFGVELAAVLGMLTFVLNFIPTVGSIIAVVLAIPMIFVAVSPGTGLGVLVLLLVVQQGIGNAVEPKLMGKGLDLHPVTVLIGLGLWGTIWGPTGMFLSAPLMAVCRIALSRHNTTLPMAELLAGRIQAPAEPAAR